MQSSFHDPQRISDVIPPPAAVTPEMPRIRPGDFPPFAGRPFSALKIRSMCPVEYKYLR